MKLIVQNEPLANDTQVVEAGLIQHALAVGIEPRNYRRLAIILQDETDAVVGGLVGATVWGWLHVMEVWVAERHRSHGWGARLLASAEREAMNRRCHHVYLDTFDFQALGFYQRLGYEVFGTLDDFPQGHTRYFVKKSLLGSARSNS
jgi:ribosomal protein S18 acetylase RimI-like enzyme